MHVAIFSQKIGGFSLFVPTTLFYIGIMVQSILANLGGFLYGLDRTLFNLATEGLITC